ncbi:MAG: 2-C-methyl-D-erythritol 4-phosphate cytidylyltransferase [Phycisphaerae bacterium]|nr:2-C-methyl-D-erythritol 4-phosphate cytidylyltransferase [Tepidisphaeraceae bacterium]
MPDFAVIIPAAGSSTRFGADKLRTRLAGKDVLHWAIEAFLSRKDVVSLVMPSRTQGFGDDRPTYADLVESDPRFTWAAGGASRAESVLSALRQIPAHVEWVAVHDGARPLVSQDLIDRTLEAAVRYGAAVPAMPVTLTIKQATGPLPARVERTIPRAGLWAMQTPQVMRRADLLAAFESCPIPLGQVTDDVQLIELAGQPVYLVEGDERNLKITTPGDIRVAESWIE